MATRAQICSEENLETIPLNSPFILLFQKQDWREYLRLIAQIYDVLEEEGAAVEFERVKALIENFYAEKGRQAAYVISKKGDFLTLAISELGVLRDSHDAAGRRQIEATREGRRLLKLCEEMILNRRKFIGAGADTLLGALNNLLLEPAALTRDAVVAMHRQKIRDYREDIRRVAAGGPLAARLVQQGVSVEELLTQAEEAASYISAAGEDIKMAIEGARKELMRAYRRKNFSAGEAIEYIADFHDALRARPEYVSFVRAKDLLSHLEGLGGPFPHKDVTEIVHRLVDRGILSRDMLRGGSLADFSRQFQNAVRGIEEKIRDQVNLLKVQVHYVVRGDPRRTQANLAEMLALAHDRGAGMLDYFSAHPPVFLSGVNIEVGGIQPHDFEVETSPDLARIVRADFEADEMAVVIEMLRKAEEATIAKALARLKEELSRREEIVLSEYEFRHGIVEYYVLARVEFFSDDIGSDPLGPADLAVRAGDREFVVCGAENKRLYFI